MTKHGTPAVIDDTTLDATRRTKLGLAGSKVAKFDGVDDAYSYAMGDAQWDKLTDEMSIECLMKDNGSLPNTTEHSVCSAKEGGGASMVVYDGKLTFTIHTDGGYRQAQAAITAGKWYHAFGTWDGDTARLYLDGQLAASIEAPGPLKRPGNLGRDGFFVGADASSTTAGQFFSPVSVAKMGLYSQALSATEIAAIHNGARTAEGAAARRSVAQAMCWDREGKLVKTLTTGETCADGVVDELGEAEYVYTGAGERIIRADAEAITIYLPGGQEVTIPRDETKNVSAHRYYTFNGETIAVRDQRGLGGVTSLVNDHHGTAIVSIPNTTWTPTSVRKQYADPFGTTRGKETTAAGSVVDRDGNGTPGDHGFLGKSNDITGLTQIGARYYDGSTGAFISPDPMLDLASPKQWNAYAYGNQSPVAQSDPTGLMVLEGTGGGSGGSSSDSNCYPGSAGCGQSTSTGGGTSSGGSSLFPGAETIELSDGDPIGQPVIDWMEHNQDSLIDASLAATEMAAWGLLSALAGVGAVACGAEAVVTSPTVVAAVPGVACAGAAAAGAGAAGYQASKSGGKLSDAILKMESTPGRASSKSADELAEIGFRSDTSHIFRNAKGHLADDTVENRALIRSALDPANLRHEITLKDGTSLQKYFKDLPDGTQAWAEVRNGEITNGGLNVIPR